MSKKKAFIPNFGSTPKQGQRLKPGQAATTQAPPPAARIKPAAIPVKSSGHRGA